MPGTKKQSAGRPCRPIRPASKCVNYLESPVAACIWMQPVYDAEPVRSSGWSNSVKIAMVVNCQPCSGTGAIVATAEVMNYGLAPASARVGQFVGHAASTLTTARAAGDRRAVDVALSIEGDAFVGFSSICAAGKTIEHSMNP